MQFPIYTLKLQGYRCGRRVSAIAAMTTDSIEDVYVVEGSVSGDIFCENVCNSLLPVLQPFNGLTTSQLS